MTQPIIRKTTYEVEFNDGEWEVVEIVRLVHTRNGWTGSGSEAFDLAVELNYQQGHDLTILRAKGDPPLIKTPPDG